MRKGARTLMAVLVMSLAVMVLGPPARAAVYEKVAVYVDGQKTDFTSGIVSMGRMPALLVEGHPMVAARFINEVLGERLDLSLSEWDIIRIGQLSFKPGCEYALEGVPSVGGDVPWRRQLPLAPRMIQAGDLARFYVPAIPTLGYLGHQAQWDADAKALRITSREKLRGQQSE